MNSTPGIGVAALAGAARAFRSAERVLAAVALVVILPARAVSSPVRDADTATPASRVTAAAPDSGLTFPRVFDQLATMAPDSTRVADVASLEIE
ncbi:MAG TPA: hypothetical protein VL123_08900, partial [Candidatus Udaeobacter sp.]|nr:hypothetical protein [Candidatus Udaeobacter sp.]